MRVYRAVRRFEDRHGTTFGAFQAVAGFATVDGDDRVVKLGRMDPADSAGSAPPPSVVRQIRKLYQEACSYLENRAYFRGYRSALSAE